MVRHLLARIALAAKANVNDNFKRLLCDNVQIGTFGRYGLDTPSQQELPWRKFSVTVGICFYISAFGLAFAAANAKTFVADAIIDHDGPVKLGGVGQAKGRTATQT